MKNHSFLKSWFIILQMIILVLLIPACKKSITPSPGPYSHDTAAYADENDTAFERGGSNYAMYSVGNYLEYPTDSVWYIPYNMRPVIGTYNLAPDTVKKQLAIMFANGQRKIALDIWYSD